MKKWFTCLGGNTKIYISFTIRIEKEVTRIDKNGEEIAKNTSYILQFVDGARFMASSLSNLIDNLFEEVHRIKCKLNMMTKNVKLMRLNIGIVTIFLNT